MTGGLVQTFSAPTEEGGLAWLHSGGLGAGLDQFRAPLPLSGDSGFFQAYTVWKQSPTTHLAPGRGRGL